MCISAVCIAQAAPSNVSSASANGTNASAKADAISPDQVILKVGEKQITREQFEQYVADLESTQGPATLSRQKLGDNYASLMMLSQQATAHDLESSPLVMRQLAIDRMQILSNAEFARLKAEAKPSEEQISAYYNAHLADYDVVEIRRAFIWKKSAQNPKGVGPEEAQALAKAIRAAVDSGSDPQKVLKDPDSAAIDPAPLKFQHGEMPEAMQKVAFAMNKPGEWVELGNREDALVLMKLVSRGRRSLDEVSEQIEKKLQNQNLREELDSLKKKSGIWMDEQYFASHVPISGPGTEPEASSQGKSDNERGER